MTQPDDDKSQQFLNEHEELAPGQGFRFACHAGVSCFGACCSALDLMLTPYDALRLRRSTGQASRDFVHEYADLTAMPGIGLPMLQMHMQDTEAKRCPFSHNNACAVYENRPSACRTYPLGRATRPCPGGVQQQIFVLREAHCKGFAEASQWNTATWMTDQGLDSYNSANDRFMALASDLRQFEQDTGRHMNSQQAGMSGLALYQPDDFQRFLVGSHLMDRLDMTDARREDVLHDEEACLDFGYDWLELSIMGHTEHLQPKS
ncbi:MAG TPA: YkgJ family cysteine cluster protein [Humidesulfovibrio sp.]|uniref:YkgJ family cysteine cluster protein n=1 Tax=Humidesulfovibrio sp. TaxID=2910988 RepID=UPI002D07CC73|nr:YkgJ family cysteine cluster protein [Humidesulfovibrio sp.]HWR04332.1 YkgJ family cysteine cluster protein [Humidesulfovibrio sp.]